MISENALLSEKGLLTVYAALLLPTPPPKKIVGQYTKMLTVIISGIKYV